MTKHSTYAGFYIVRTYIRGGSVTSPGEDRLKCYDGHISASSDVKCGEASGARDNKRTTA